MGRKLVGVYDLQIVLQIHLPRRTAKHIQILNGLDQKDHDDKTQHTVSEQLFKALLPGQQQSAGGHEKAWDRDPQQHDDSLVQRNADPRCGYEMVHIRVHEDHTQQSRRTYIIEIGDPGSVRFHGIPPKHRFPGVMRRPAAVWYDRSPMGFRNA